MMMKTIKSNSNISLNYEKEGELICLDEKGKKIYINNNNDNKVRNGYNSIYNKNKFKLAVNPKRQVITAFGSSGSGKSYFLNQYLKEYQKKYKDNDIYVFSVLKEDKSLDDGIKNMIRVPLNLETLQNINIDDFNINDCCVFDDIDTIKDKKLLTMVYNILNIILETGRHKNIYCLIAVHILNKGHMTRSLINESHICVYYPFQSGATINYVLNNHLGLSKKQIQFNKNHLDSRWCAVYRYYPNILISEKYIKILNDD